MTRIYSTIKSRKGATGGHPHPPPASFQRSLGGNPSLLEWGVLFLRPWASEEQGDSLMKRKVNREKTRRPRTAAARDAALFSSNCKPIIDPCTNPPNLIDISEDRTRNKRLQAARAAWGAAERLLSLNAATGEITKAFEEAQGHFASVGQATPRQIPECQN